MAGRQRHQASSLYPAAFSYCRLPYEVSSLDGDDLRYALLDLFLTTPTGDIEVLSSLHERLYSRDPLFYGLLGAWYIQRGTIMDHKEIFLAYLFTSSHREHREIASRLVPLFPVKELSRAVDYCKRVVQKFPRIARTTVQAYLRRVENKPGLFDELVLSSRKHLKHLYASLRLKPSPRAQAILFNDSPPPDSMLADLKALLREREPEEQARLIIRCGAPLSVALKYIKNLTSLLVVRLIENLSPGEILHNLNTLRNRGVMKDEEVRSLLEDRVNLSVTEKKANARHARSVTRNSRSGENLASLAEAIIMQCREGNIAIERPTALLIDKSGSMDEALELGKVVAILCSALAKTNFFAYAFNNDALALQPAAQSPEGWADLFSTFLAGGATSPGSALVSMTRNREKAEQIVLITDGNENHDPGFFEALSDYQRALHITPFIVLVRMGHFSGKFTKKMVSMGICGTTCSGSFDRSWLSSLIVLLSGSPRQDYLREILAPTIPDEIKGP